MRTGRAIIFSAILALGAAAPILASPGMAAAAGHAPAAHVQAAPHGGSSKVYYQV
jgi:hypothetical protein